jgi:hypothetical protein
MWVSMLMLSMNKSAKPGIYELCEAEFRRQQNRSFNVGEQSPTLFRNIDELSSAAANMTFHVITDSRFTMSGYSGPRILTTSWGPMLASDCFHVFFSESPAGIGCLRGELRRRDER